MTAEDLKMLEKERNKSRDELLEIIVALRRQLTEQLGYRIDNSNALTAMAVEFQKAKQEVLDLRAENRELKEALARMTAKEPSELRHKPVMKQRNQAKNVLENGKKIFPDSPVSSGS